MGVVAYIGPDKIMQSSYSLDSFVIRKESTA